MYVYMPRLDKSRWTIVGVIIHYVQRFTYGLTDGQLHTTIRRPLFKRTYMYKMYTTYMYYMWLVHVHCSNVPSWYCLSNSGIASIFGFGYKHIPTMPIGTRVFFYRFIHNKLTSQNYRERQPRNIVLCNEIRNPVCSL